jgi:dynein heavy chain 1
VDTISKGRSNIAPESIPWDALQQLLTQSLYGGKVDNDYDSKILQSFVEHLFNEKAYDLQYPLFIGEDALTMPDARTMS